MPAHRLNTVQVYGIREATESVDSPARALLPDPGVLAPTLAHVGPTTPKQFLRNTRCALTWQFIYIPREPRRWGRLKWVPRLAAP